MKQAGQIILFRFPQTDLEEGKLHPALLLGKLPGDYGDWLICRISSQTHHYGKRLELLKEAVPDLARVAVFVDGTVTAQQRQEAQLASQVLGITLQSLEGRGPNPDLDGAFSTATRQGADALFIPAGPVLNLHRKRVVDLAAQSRLPAMYFHRGFADAGGLISYSPSLPDLWRRAATYVDKILKGTNPADLPVEQPMKFRAGHQPEDGPGARAHDPPDAPLPVVVANISIARVARIKGSTSCTAPRMVRRGPPILCGRLSRKSLGPYPPDLSIK